MFLNLMTNPGLLWFIAGLAMLITELFAPSLVLMFFGLGAWVVTVLYLVFNIGFSAQLIVFGVASLLLLALLRKKLKSVFLGYVSSRQESGKNMEDSFGKEAIVVVRIEPARPGKVEYNGVAWDAEADDSIEIDTRVKIIDRNGLRFKVTRL